MIESLMAATAEIDHEHEAWLTKRFCLGPPACGYPKIPEETFALMRIGRI
jgi:hypothetical protein